MQQITYSVEGSEVRLTFPEGSEGQAWLGVDADHALNASGYWLLVDDVIATSEGGEPIVWTVPAGEYELSAYTHAPGDPFTVLDSIDAVVVVEGGEQFASEGSGLPEGSGIGFAVGFVAACVIIWTAAMLNGRRAT